MKQTSPLLKPLADRAPLPWITTMPGVPYFQTEQGDSWHPIGQNDAISWRELNPLFLRKDIAAADGYLALLAEHGVTCMRLMLEYAQVRHRYFESSPGTWSPNLVRFWDDLFMLCERRGIRILLTPFDTFWMWLHFRHHPYNAKNGGPLRHPSRLLLSKETRVAIKARLTFAAERWGGSGALFAWDIWNEIHPAQAQMSAVPFFDFIADISDHLRTTEVRKHGRSHPQTVSLFGPELKWRSHMEMEPAIFRHPSMDFATIHIYEQGTIDNPANTVDAAVGMGRIVRECISQIDDDRPFLDTEHGPIHRFKDHHETLPEAFDDEYFRHMQWAHLASGGAGGGMRWPNRHPHSLTPGMRTAQRAMSKFLPEINWNRFARKDVSKVLTLTEDAGRIVGKERVARFGCASPTQALIYLLRRDTLLPTGLLDRYATPITLSLQIPAVSPGRYRLVIWDTAVGATAQRCEVDIAEGNFIQLGSLAMDCAIALQRME